MQKQPLIVASGLRKSYGDVHALRGLKLTVGRGEVLVLLGPNGAGKTTLVRILATLLTPDEGTATVDGLDVVKDAEKLRRRIGLAGQYAAVDENLTARENLELVGRFYHIGSKESRGRAAALLERVGLTEDADRPSKGYSGGMRRRLDLAMSLIGEPQVIFMDEPTTGLDPPSRIALWRVVEELRRGGKTILLTTQNLEEADRLADRIAVVDRGTIIAEGTADHLKTRVGGDVVELTLRAPDLFEGTLAALKGLKPSTDPSRHRITVPAPRGAKSLALVLARLDAKTLAATEVSLRRPTLDDVFLSLTGHTAEPQEASA